MSDLNPFISNGTCYWGPDEETDEDIIPCGNAGLGHKTCCYAGDMCIRDNICFNEESGFAYAVGCSDPKVKGKGCPQNLLDVLHDNQWVLALPCDDDDIKWLDCPNGDFPETMDDVSGCECPNGDAPTTTIDATRAASIVQLPNAHGESVVWQAGFVPTEVRWLPTSSPLSSSASFSSASSYSSSPPSSPSETLPLVTLSGNDDFKDNSDYTDAGDDEDTRGSEDKEEADGRGSGLSAGAKAGIGVGVALAVLFILGVAFLLLRKRRRRIPAEGTWGPAVPAEPRIGPAHPSGMPSELGGSTVRPWSTISELDGAGVTKVARDGNRGSWLRSGIDGGGVRGYQRENPVTELPV